MVPGNITKKEDTNKLTTLAFKMIPILHKTLLATPKIKFFLGLLLIFWGPPTNPPTTIFMGPNSNFILGEFVPLGRIPNSNFSPGAFAQFVDQLGLLWFKGSKSYFTLGHFSFWESPKRKFCLVLLPILGAHWDLLGFRGSKSNFTLGTFSFWGVSQTQIILRGFSPFWGPTGAFWGSGAQNQILFRGFYPSLGSRTII
jgi:hypothetical protein